MTFQNSRRLNYTALYMAFGLMVLIVFKPSPEAAQVLMLGVPSLIGLVSLFTKFTNEAEVAGK